MFVCIRLQINCLLNVNVYIWQGGKKILKKGFLGNFLGAQVAFIQHDIQNVFHSI